MSRSTNSRAPALPRRVASIIALLLLAPAFPTTAAPEPACASDSPETCPWLSLNFVERDALDILHGTRSERPLLWKDTVLAFDSSVLEAPLVIGAEGARVFLHDRVAFSPGTHETTVRVVLQPSGAVLTEATFVSQQPSALAPTAVERDWELLEFDLSAAAPAVADAEAIRIPAGQSIRLELSARVLESAVIVHPLPYESSFEMGTDSALSRVDFRSVGVGDSSALPSPQARTITSGEWVHDSGGYRVATPRQHAWYAFPAAFSTSLSIEARAPHVRQEGVGHLEVDARNLDREFQFYDPTGAARGPGPLVTDLGGTWFLHVSTVGTGHAFRVQATPYAPPIHDDAGSGRDASAAAPVAVTNESWTGAFAGVEDDLDVYLLRLGANESVRVTVSTLDGPGTPALTVWRTGRTLPSDPTATRATFRGESLAEGEYELSLRRGGATSYSLHVDRTPHLSGWTYEPLAVATEPLDIASVDGAVYVADAGGIKVLEGSGVRVLHSGRYGSFGVTAEGRVAAISGANHSMRLLEPDGSSRPLAFAAVGGAVADFGPFGLFLMRRDHETSDWVLVEGRDGGERELTRISTEEDASFAVAPDGSPYVLHREVLHRVDAGTGAVERIETDLPDVQWPREGMAFDMLGRVLVVSQSPIGPTRVHLVYRVDPTNGRADVVAAVPESIGIMAAGAPDGLLIARYRTPAPDATNLARITLDTSGFEGFRPSIPPPAAADLAVVDIQMERKSPYVNETGALRLDDRLIIVTVANVGDAQSPAGAKVGVGLWSTSLLEHPLAVPASYANQTAIPALAPGASVSLQFEWRSDRATGERNVRAEVDPLHSWYPFHSVLEIDERSNNVRTESFVVKLDVSANDGLRLEE